MIDTKNATETIRTITASDVVRYSGYFAHIKPTTDEDRFQRWLFAFASIHTTWERNCILYEKLKDMDWMGDPELLKQRVLESRAGLHNQRAERIMRFARQYWGNPGWYMRGPAETWVDYRDRLMANIDGLGQAKSTFGLELIHLDEAELICTDTHVMQLYGYQPSTVGKCTSKDERAMERHFVSECRKAGIPPVIARWRFWDIKQNQPDSRYWTRTLETPEITAKLDAEKEETNDDGHQEHLGALVGQ